MRLFLHPPSPQLLKHLYGRWAMPGVMVIRIGVDLNLPLVNFPENFRPLRQLQATGHDDLVPNLRLLLNSFAVPEPAHISEVGGDGVEPLEPLSGSGHPRLVNQGQRNPALSQGLNELQDEPILVSDFDGELVVLWQAALLLFINLNI
jgi:hypothetical protein